MTQRKARPAFFAAMAWVVLILLALVPPCRAAAPTPTPSSASTPATAPSLADLQTLEQALQNPAQRQILISEIKALIAVQHHVNGAHGSRPGSVLVSVLSGAAVRAGRAVAALARLTPWQTAHVWQRRLTADPALRAFVLRQVGTVLGVLALALLGWWGMWRALRAPANRLRRVPRHPEWRHWLAALAGCVLSLLPAALMLVVGYAALAVAVASLGLDALSRALALDVLAALAATRAISGLVETLLLAEAAGERFLPVADSTAEYCLVWTMRLANFAALGWFGLDFAHQAGLSDAGFAILLKAYGLLMTGLLVMLILQNRQSVAQTIGGQPDGRAWARLRFQLGKLWYLVALAYLVGAYVVWAATVPGGFAFLLRASVLSALALLVARVIDVLGTRIANRFLSIGPVLEQRLPGLQSRVNIYSPLLLGLGRALVYGVALVVALQAWDVDFLDALETKAGLHAIGACVTIIVIMAIALMTWEAVSLATELYLNRQGADGTPAARSARVRTLLPLFRKSFAVTLGIIVILISLATIGVNIAPLLAGAGIVGIAVGFGAQSFVKDVITGLSILMQDAVSVGDVVTVAGNSGLVEQISIRTIRLRNLSGTVIVVPFSEVSTVKNLTKDFSYALFDIGIAYREDVDEVVKVVKALADELQQDADYAWRIMKPIEILGLDQFADSAVIVKARIMTLPIQQWSVMREFNRRMKRRFDELGIEIPFPHQTIYFGEDKAGKAPPARVRMEENTDAGLADG